MATSSWKRCCASPPRAWPRQSTFFFFNDTATTEIYTLPYTTLFRSDVGRLALGVFLTVWFLVVPAAAGPYLLGDRKSTRLNSSHSQISYAVFSLKTKGGSSSPSARPPP